jgi:hypothetical protein
VFSGRVDVRVDVIALVTGVLLVSAWLAGIVTVEQALMVAGTAAMVTWRVYQWTRPSRRNRGRRSSAE